MSADQRNPKNSAPSKEVANYADIAMFRAQSIDRTAGPRVFLLSCNNDPLGSIAAAAKAYKGEFVESLSQITDDERRYYLAEVQKSVLAMPLEAVQFHFRITGVTRGFTHQMVRQRTAAYSQESTRFAVKEDVPVGLPPSIQGTQEWDDFVADRWKELYPNGGGTLGEVTAYAMDVASKEQMWRYKWDFGVSIIEQQYNALINDGMPAEDARGLLPTNLLTQINYITDLRGLKEHAGVRLCTQAQFEWRQVWAQMVQAIREYGKNQTYSKSYNDNSGQIGAHQSSQWQFDALADIFRPICYYRGSCQFQADFDRHCSIRDRVQQNADWNIPSTQWDKGTPEYTVTNEQREILPIFPAEWLLDPSAARTK